MTERNHNEADSGRSIEEKKNADVLDPIGPVGDPDAYLVQYPDGSMDYEPATARNTALFEDGLYERVQGKTSTSVTVGDTTVSVELVADVGDNEFTLLVDGQEVPVPDEYVTDLVTAFDGARGAALGSRLYNIYQDIVGDQVRRHIVQQFEDRFPSDRVEVTPEGWVVDDTFLVTYEATNELVDTDPVSPRGDGYDEAKQAVYLDLDASEPRMLTTPEGDSVEVEPDEQVFLTMVEGLLYPEDYFEATLVDEVQQHKSDSETLDDVIEQMTEQAEVTGFTDSKTGIHHGTSNHSFRKHDVSDLNVTDEVREKLWSNPYDHASVHEMLLRKQEFVNSDADVFEDAEDDDEWKWDEIEKTSESAPIPPEVRSKLDEMFA